MTLTRLTFTRAALATSLLAGLITAASPAAAQKEWTVHSFPADASQGVSPYGNLVADSDGNLYGTTFSGGPFLYFGTVYELVRPVPPKTAWTATILYNFPGSPDAGEPDAGLIFDKSGNLYGISHMGGYDYGTVFKLSPPVSPGGAWTESVLYSFGQGEAGIYPWGELIQDDAGNLYGTTSETTLFGSCKESCGTVFRLSPPATPGEVWTETILHTFVYPQEYPFGLVSDSQGNLYGTADGGAHGMGIVYRLLRPATAGGTWSYRVLHAFGPTAAGSPEGAYPSGPLTLHGKGVLYGTTGDGGLYDSGTVFQLVPPTVAGAVWTENVLYSFSGGISDGQSPNYGVIFDSAGNLYGSTTNGGDVDGGVVFKLVPPLSSGGDWTESVLHSFDNSGGGKDGVTPSGGLLFGKNGVLFGVTVTGGTGNVGAVFGLLP